MHKKQQKQTIPNLSDKDIHLLRKTYSKLTELFYENTQNQSVVIQLIILGSLIPQVISTPRQASVLGLLPIIEPLKIKSKSQPKMKEHIESVINHIKNPSYRDIQYKCLLPSLQKSDLFTVGCTIAIRFYQSIVTSSTSEYNWKEVITELSRNIAINPSLCIELTYLICRQNQNYCRTAVKSGLIKYIFLSYLASTLDNRYYLHKAIKLLKVVANADSTLLRQKQKGLALVIYTYDDYVPMVQGIISRCYDNDYCQNIDNKRKYDTTTLDQPYLWSYFQLFCLNNLSQPTIKELTVWFQNDLSEVQEKKIYGILSNYSKFKKTIMNNVLQILPKTQSALLNYIKLCVNCCEIDHNSHKYIDIKKLQQLVDKSLNPKVENLFKYLKQLRNKQSKIGSLSEHYKKMFDMQKNADFMMERAARVPQKNDDLNDIEQILKEKERTNQFQADTLITIKKRALKSLNTSVMQNNKLDLNGILQHVNLGNVKLLAKLLQILELSLTMNDDLIASIDVLRILEIIQWIQDNYDGQIIQWGSISQLIIMLTGEGQWKLHFHQITQKSFWLLSIQSLNREDQTLIWEIFSKFGVQSSKYQHKIPFLIGFLGRALTNDGKLRFYNLFPKFFEILSQNIKENSNPSYKITLIMLSAFIKDWHISSQNQQSAKNNHKFLTLIQPIVESVLHNFRGLEQEFQFLENCLPYNIKYDQFADNLDYLVNIYGRLASYIYRQQLQKGGKLALNYDRIKMVSKLPPIKSRTILQILRFLQQNSNILQTNLLIQLLKNFSTKDYVYWLSYPNFFNIISKIIQILSITSNPTILADTSTMLCNLINLIINNEDISNDEKIDLLNQIKKCLQILSIKGINIDKEFVRKYVEKISFQDIRVQIIQILLNYKIVQNVTQKPKTEDISQQYSSNIVPPVTSDIVEDIQKNQLEQQNTKQIIQHLQAETNIIKEEELDVLGALRILKKIIQNKQSEQKFPLLYHVFTTQDIKSQYMDILGHLLAYFYPNRPEEMQIYSLQLLMNKQKTRLSRQGCYQLLSQYPQTFSLSRRWKLRGRQWLDLSMKRFSEGYYADASSVAQQNLTKISQLQHFLSQNYHELIISAYPNIVKQQDQTFVIMLIGTSARNTKIKHRYYRQKLHIKMLQLIHNYGKKSKFFANLLYALSSLVYTQQQVCADLIKCKNELQIILNQLRSEVGNKAIVESGACFIANISYSNQQVKQTLRQLGVISVFIYLLENVLEDADLNTFKQVLRAFGNLSLSTKCSQELIDHHFCLLAVKMTQKMDIQVNFQDKKAPLLKMLLDLISNLASHRYKLQLFHKEGITDLLIELLDVAHTYLPILTSSIDTIDCLCQNSQIENYFVTTKMIAYILVDLLKIQTDEKLVVKSTRLLTNLTINPACVPHILRANFLSVMANIVMPHFYGNKMAAQQNKKMQTYILKITSRIYHSKPDKQTIIESGYLDCLIRTIQTSQNIEDTYIDLLYYYSQIMPNFLNKRAFISLIRILTKKINTKQIIIKCLRAIKKLSSFYEKDQQDFFIKNTQIIYQKLFNCQMKDQGLELFIYHLFRSNQLRIFIREYGQKIIQIVKKIGESSQYSQRCKIVMFLVYNPYQLFSGSQDVSGQEEYQELKKGWKCKLYRSDGSFKKAYIDMTQDYQLRAYKFPDGEIKNKYIIDIRNIKDFQFNYPVSTELWGVTLFNQEKGIFDTQNCVPKNCMTLVSSKKWGSYSFVNVEFESEKDKLRFQYCLRVIYNCLR